MIAPTERDKGTAAHAVLNTCLTNLYQWGWPVRAAEYEGAEIDVEDGPHELLSPSGAKRWMNCPASVEMQKNHPEPTPPEAMRPVFFDTECVNAVQMALDYVAMRVKEIAAERGPVVVHSEFPVDPAPFLGADDLFAGTTVGLFAGTTDVALVAREYAEVIDFKLGAAVQVDPVDPQLDQYLLGLCSAYATTPGNLKSVPFKSARLTVVQPRNFRHPQKIRWREIPSLQAWAQSHIARTVAAWLRIEQTPDIFSPSPETCYGCSAKGVCAANFTKAFKRAGVLSGEDTLPVAATEVYDLCVEASVRDTRTLTGEQLRGILDARDMLKGALQATEAWALDQLMKGTAPPEIVQHYKLVRGRSSRKWAEPEEIVLKRLRRLKVRGPGEEKERALGKKDLTESRLKSAPQVEQLLKTFAIPGDDARWAAFNNLVEKPEGALTIAPVSDPRDPVAPLRTSPDQAFDPETVNPKP